MGRLSRGFLGGFQGQLGTGYGCFWRLMDLVKAMPRKVKRAATEAQLPARLKMALMTSFLSALRSIIDVGFKQAKKPGQSAMNAAVSYNLKNAITGTSPNYTIDFPKLLFSKGSLTLPLEVNVTAETGAKIRFEWEIGDAGTENGAPDDKAILVVFNETTGYFVVLTGAASRSELQFSLQLPPPFMGNMVHCYLSFVSANGKEVSNSIYVAQLEVV